MTATADNGASSSGQEPAGVADERHRGGRLLILFVGSWLSLALCDYLALPLYGLVSVFGILVLGTCWVGAVMGSVATVTELLTRRAYGWAAGALIAALLCGFGVLTTDWTRLYVDSQFALHRAALAELAARHRSGGLPVHTTLPWRLRYLSIDGQAHQRDGALYLPMWQDWRAERGAGIGYFPTRPGPDTMIATASGDIGGPVRHLGDGWWVVG